MVFYFEFRSFFSFIIRWTSKRDNFIFSTPTFVIWYFCFLRKVCNMIPLFSQKHTKEDTVPLKSKLTLETRTSRLDPRASMLETFEDRVLSIVSRGSSLEDRETRLSRICKNSKGFRENDLFLDWASYLTGLYGNWEPKILHSILYIFVTFSIEEAME